MVNAGLESSLNAVAERTLAMIDRLESNLEMLHGIAKPVRAQRSFHAEDEPQPPRYVKAIYRRFNGEKSLQVA